MSDKMTRPLTNDFNALTGKSTSREMNDAEFAQYEKDLATAEAQKQLEADDAAKKAALLDRLGITADEAKLLLS